MTPSKMDDPASEAALLAAIQLDPNNVAATLRLAVLLFGAGDLARAEQYARNAVRMAPTDPRVHDLMGMLMTEGHRPQAGEHHYRRALELAGAGGPILLANLAWNLKTQGRLAEGRALFEQAFALEPNSFNTLYGWARLEEADREFARAGELLDAADRVSPGNPNLLLQRALLHGRVRQYDEALAVLAEIDRRLGPPDPSQLGFLVDKFSEQGRILDQMGRQPEAFAAFAQAKRAHRDLTGETYLAADAAALAGRLAGFFVAPRVAILPRATLRTDVAQPIFIVGFPRSGTTMIEQTLSAHPRITAGDELPIITELTELAPTLLHSPLPYPEALSELWLGDRAGGLDTLRDLYLQRARQLGALRDDADWFTDKMPLNETHLGLIGLVFPRAPIIHLLRHPLDVVLSVFSNTMTHGFHCGGELETIARHYLLTMELVDHYRRQMPLRYLAVRYEDVIDNQEAKVREILAFMGAPFDPACLNFHENPRAARTASYAQVTEKLYDRSRYRYRGYREQLAPVIPMLEPIIRRLGYAVE
jgi:tetratricopeptide (TPR) repeat protein